MIKRAPVFAGLTALIFTIFGILQMVSAIKALSAYSAYGSYGGSYMSFAKGTMVFELIATIVILLISMILMIMAVKDASEKSLYGTTAGLLGTLTLYSIIDTFLAYSLLKKMFGDYVSMPGSGIAKLVFLFLAMILIIAGLLTLGSYANDDKAGIVFIIAVGCLLFCCIISFAAMDRFTDGLTITSTVFLLLALLSAGFEFINSYGYSGYVSTTPKTVHHTTYNPYSYNQPSSKSGNEDAAEELRKLKQLYDDGLITSEEYNEKRKKYVDKL